MELDELIKKGFDYLGESTGAIVGASIGATAGTLIAGPAGLTVGIASGATAGKIVTDSFVKIGEMISKEKISSRGQMRIGALFILVNKKVQEEIGNGRPLRKGDSFWAECNGRSVADEITEGIFRSTETDHEEKKLPYYANLLVSFGFDEKVGGEMANLMTRTVKEISYRQIKLLAVFKQKSKYFAYLKAAQQKGTIAYTTEKDRYAPFDIKQEVESLAQLGLFNTVKNPTSSIKYSVLTELGELLYSKMKLEVLPENELKELTLEMREIARE